MENNIISICDHMPVGFRFRPTDEELVNYYLKHKLLADDFPVHIIPEIDLCKVEPWDVPERSVIKSDDPEWFFFSPVDYKYLKSKRFNRTTKRGYWKTTGNDRNVKIPGTNNVIGTKKTLVFHEGRVPRGVKTNWVIHEYHAVTSHESQRDFVLCRLMKKAEKKNEGGIEAPTFDEGEPSVHLFSDYGNQVDIIPGVDMEEIFQAVDRAEKFSPPVQRSQTGIGLEDFFANSPLFDAHFGSENINMQTSLEVTDDEELVNSFWVDDEEFVINEERRHCFVNSSTQPKSFRRVYNESSEIDAEVVSNLVKIYCPKSE
ncbi:NAC domain-containing protein 62 isoform C [Glycine soja]|uniref:NAC domain-containing protein 62 isoform C n=1 Tax=Glycine soja TaxID=3848 RepID=A0A445JSE2_GLYSO|nr:NAC domain-containing protein 62 isoform C [Glycine soja]